MVVPCCLAASNGLRPASDSYICAFVPPGLMPKTVSMELIAKVAGELLTMTGRPLPPR